jgi:hypothetical protein
MGRTYSYDSKMLLSDNAAAYTASGIGQVASASAILNLGGTGDVRTDLGVIGLTGGRGDHAAIINVTALTTATDGQANLWIMGSNNSDGSKPVVLGGQQVGLGSTLPNGSGTTTQTDVLGTGSTTSPGRREIFFSTEQNGIFYQYIYLYVQHIGSTSHSVSVHAYVAKLPIE